MQLYDSNSQRGRGVPPVKHWLLPSEQTAYNWRMVAEASDAGSR